MARGWRGSFTERLRRVSLTFSVCSPERPWQRLLFAARGFRRGAGAARTGGRAGKVAGPGVWANGLCSESLQHCGIAADTSPGPAVLLVGPGATLHPKWQR